MTIKYAPIMTWMRYVEMNIWIIKTFDLKNLVYEEEIIKKFNDLYKNELVREGNGGYEINPYRGIGYISVHICGEKDSFIVKDNYGYLSCYHEGIYGSFSKRKLAFNKKLHGFNKEYFKFIEKEDDEYIFVENVVSGTVERSPNIKRLINALFLRPQPYVEQFDQKDIMFWDYSIDEKRMILEECHKY